MNHKALLGTAVAAALMFGAQFASACTNAAWTTSVGLTAANTGEPTAGFKRYSGRCGAQISDAATPRYFEDASPAAESAYEARFYYYTGDISGNGDIFQARNTGGTNIIRIVANGTNLSFTTNTGAGAQTVTVQDNKWYAIELSWSAGAGTGSMTATVTGASGNAVAPAVAGTVNFANLSNASDVIDAARIGIIAGTPAVTAPVYFDEFDSRRTTSPGLLCRGDAASPPNNVVNVFDAVAVINEAGGNPALLSSGQPDCTEDGTINVFDGVCVVAVAGGPNASCL